MKYILSLFRKFVKWLQPKHTIEFVEDVPLQFTNKTIYIVGLEKDPWLISFKCPCGCNSIINLNLLKEAKPRWKFSFRTKKKINISPSVNRLLDCKSHFFIRNSKIDWV